MDCNMGKTVRKPSPRYRDQRKPGADRFFRRYGPRWFSSGGTIAVRQPCRRERCVGRLRGVPFEQGRILGNSNSRLQVSPLAPRLLLVKATFQPQPSFAMNLGSKYVIIVTLADLRRRRLGVSYLSCRTPLQLPSCRPPPVPGQWCRPSSDSRPMRLGSHCPLQPSTMMPRATCSAGWDGPLALGRSRRL